MSDIVILGASGFIGQAVCREFLARKEYTIHAVSRSEHQSSNPKLRWYQAKNIKEIPKIAGATYIHLAGDNRATISNENSEERLKDASEQARYLLDSTSSRIIYASSGVVYGDKSNLPHTEGDPTFSHNLYAQEKLVFEQVLLTDPRVAVVRLANIYGIGMSKNNVFSTIIQQLPGNGEIQVLDATPIRDYLYISDAAAGICDLAISKHSGIFNLSTGIGTSVNELIEIISQVAGLPKVLVKEKQKSAVTSSLVLSPNKMASILQWKAKTDLKTGVKAIISEAMR